ncbi:MAG TPA: rRNA maturation RNase YbeY [Candidatus Paceibacterota bacterium]
MRDKNLNITNTVKTRLPKLPYTEMKEAVLGKKYELSVIIVNKNKIKKLNRKYRDIDKATDILSFPLSENFGEMYINLDMTKSEAKKIDRTYENFLAFLFIHGLTHLKGFDHGSTMESIEARFRKKFGI